MPIPDWSEMPESFTGKKIDEEDLLAAAKIRNAHRALMSVRWRSKVARAADKKSGKLHIKWHEWMACPADSYQQANKDGSYICVCDSWSDAKRQQRPSRNRMDAWLVLRASEAALSVKSIDTENIMDTLSVITPTQDEANDRIKPFIIFPRLSKGLTSGRGYNRRDQSSRPQRRNNRIKRRLHPSYEARVTRERYHLCAV